MTELREYKEEGGHTVLLDSENKLYFLEDKKPILCESHGEQFRLAEDKVSYCSKCEESIFKAIGIWVRDYICEFHNKDDEKTMWGNAKMKLKMYPDPNSMYDYVCDDEYDCIIYRKDGKELGDKEIKGISEAEADNFSRDFEYIPIEIKTMANKKKLLIRVNEEQEKKDVLDWYRKNGIDTKKLHYNDYG